MTVKQVFFLTAMGATAVAYGQTYDSADPYAAGSYGGTSDYTMTPVSEPRAASYYQRSVSGSVSVGYDSRYMFHDIAVTPLLNSSGVFNFAGEIELPLVANMRQHIGLTYGAITDGILSDREMFEVNWAAGTEIFPNLKAGVGYDLNYGGLPGYMAKMRGKAPHSVAQDVNGFLKYDDPGRGWFGGLEVYGGFYGLTGWRIDLEVGKRWEGFLTPQSNLEVSLGTGYSSGFWAGSVSGFDQVNVKAALPFALGSLGEDRGFRLVPFIQAIWAGDNRGEINRACGVRVMDDFQVVGGVKAEFRF